MGEISSREISRFSFLLCNFFFTFFLLKFLLLPTVNNYVKTREEGGSFGIVTKDNKMSRSRGTFPKPTDLSVYIELIVKYKKKVNIYTFLKISLLFLEFAKD